MSTLPKLRQYQFSMSGGGVAKFELIYTPGIPAADIAELKEWLAIITRQLDRLPVATAQEDATQAAPAAASTKESA